MPITANRAGRSPSPFAQRPLHRRQRGLEHRDPHRGQRGAHLRASTACRAGPRTRRAAARDDAASGPSPRRDSGSGWRADRAQQRGGDVGRVALQLVGVARRGRGEQPQHLRRAHEQVRHQRRRAEQPHEPLRDQPLVPQQPQVPRACRPAPRTPAGRPAGRGRDRGCGRARRAARAAGSAGSPRRGRPRRSARAGAPARPPATSSPARRAARRPPSPTAAPSRPTAATPR